MNDSLEHGGFSRRLSACMIAGCLMLTPGISAAIDFKISGQVSRMLVLPDDAEGDELQNQDIGWSGSRFRITGSEQMDNGVTVGFRFERQAQSNPATRSTGGGQVNAGDDTVDNRYQDVWFAGNFGRIALGKGDGAANGSTEADLSGTALSSSSNHQDNWGNYRILPGVAWDTIFTMADGIGRVSRLRYDTPSYDGFKIAISMDQGNAFEVGVKYTREWDGHKMDLRAFTVDGDDFLNDDELTGFSASILLSNGFNVTLAASDTDRDSAADRDAFTVKLGYKTGPHAFTVDFGEGETGSDEADTFGLTYASVVHPGVEVFATVRELDSDVSGAESVDITAIGTRVKF